MIEELMNNKEYMAYHLWRHHLEKHIDSLKEHIKSLQKELDGVERYLSEMECEALNLLDKND